MSTVESRQFFPLNNIDSLFRIKGSDDQIRSNLFQGYGNDNKITYLLSHIKTNRDVSVVRDQHGHLTWTIGDKQIALGSSWWDRCVHKIKRAFSSSYVDKLEAKLNPKIAKVMAAYTKCWLAEVDAKELKRNAIEQKTEESKQSMERIGELNAKINRDDNELIDLHATIVNLNKAKDEKIAKKNELQASKDIFLPEKTYEDQLVALGMAVNAYKQILFFVNAGEEEVIKAAEDLIGAPLRTDLQRQNKSDELNKKLNILSSLSDEIELCDLAIEQFNLTVTSLEIQAIDKEQSIENLKALLQLETIVDVVPSQAIIKAYVPLAADFISINTSIREFTASNFKNEMSVSQIRALNRQLMSSIRKDIEYKNIKKSSVKNGCEALSNKLEELCLQQVISAKSVWSPELQLKSDRDYIIYNIIRGKLPSLDQVKSDPALVSAVIWGQDLAVMDEARNLIQNLLADLNRQLSSPDLKPSDEFHLEMIMGDLLALYPYLMPKNGEVIKLPAKIDGIWSLIDYETDRIEMTSNLLSSPLVAYGMRPAHESAPPVLIFKGTTYPTDEGALMSIMTDINPFGSVGDYGFRMGKEKIKTWLESQVSTAKVNIYGKSLGGAQSWRTAINFPKNIGKVMTYGAPGFAPLELSRLNTVTEKYPELQFNFFCQKNDLVHFSDFAAKKGVNYYEVLNGEFQTNVFAAHSDMYSTQESSMILKMQAEDIQAPGKRAVVTIARLIASLLFPVVSVAILLNAIARTTVFVGKETVKLVKSLGKKPPSHDKLLEMNFN